MNAQEDTHNHFWTLEPPSQLRPTPSRNVSWTQRLARGMYDFDVENPSNLSLKESISGSASAGSQDGSWRKDERCVPET